LRGATSAYVTFQPDLAVAWAADAIGALAKTAVDCGLRHIVLLSGRGEDGAERSEEMLKAAGIGRNSRVMNGVAEILGRPPKDFSQYARETAETGLWGT
jgi:hypothetical protein